MTDTKQNINRSLVNISDEALSFFELLHNSVCHLQGPHALTKHEAGVLNVVKSHTLLDTNIQQQFTNCFDTDDDINIINILYNDCVIRYLAGSNNQFRKSLVHKMRSKTSAAHRVEIAKVKTTCGKESEAKKQKKVENTCSMCGGRYNKCKYSYIIYLLLSVHIRMVHLLYTKHLVTCVAACTFGK